jgi:hypothetical protein
VLAVIAGCAAADEMTRDEPVENVPEERRAEAPAPEQARFVMPDPEAPRDYGKTPGCEEASERLVQLSGDETQRARWLEDCRGAWTASDRECVVRAATLAGATACRSDLRRSSGGTP